MKIEPFYKGKRVFLTGDTGFKGSWLGMWLRDMGADVVGYALPPKSQRDHFVRLNLARKFHHINGDILNFRVLRNAFSGFRPQILFHLAAQPIVRLSYTEPKLTFDTNVGGFLNLLETARQSKGLKAAVFVTSDKCYKNKEVRRGYHEEEELGGHDPYSASKAAAEIAFASYLSSFFSRRPGFGAATARAGNVIGGGDWSMDRIVPDCIKSLERQMPVVLRNPAATRPWQHVLEPLSGYLLLAAQLYRHPKKYSGSFNFGPNEDSIHTVKELTEKIVRYWGGGTISIRKSPSAPHETNILRLNCNKARSILGWSQRWDFERTLLETVHWYKEASHANADVVSLTRDQINAYSRDIKWCKE